jgi:serine/threonine-protein kinase ULK2
MHRDLKPDNIFFSNGVVKLGDFGFCKSLEKANMTKTMLGSPIYMAPEILRGEIYSTKADIWSLGVVLYEMLYGFCPFESTTIPKLIEVLKETELEFPNTPPVSEETKRLVKRLLTKDPTRRIEWMELLKVNITNEGRIANDGRGVISLVEEEGGSILDNAKLLQSSKFTPVKEERIEENQSYSPQPAQ